MDLALVRTELRMDGIFSEVREISGDMLFVSLEHAFQDPFGAFVPKIPDGIYTCVRGMHRLFGMIHDFETFEITGVSGHTGLLFHTGNLNADSNGCVILGMNLAQISGMQAVSQSREAFAEFMSLQASDEFILTVKSS